MERWCGKVAIVTGASAGIGEAIAEKLVNAGMLVVGLARRVERIESKAKSLNASSDKGKLYAVKCDMTCENDIRAAFEWTAKNVGALHILVNNAGANPGTSLLDGVTDRWRQCFEVNVMGLLIATREATQAMRAHQIDGHIVNINSVLGHANFYFPGANVYPATKHAVTNLTETLRQELIANQSNIKVTSVSPGAVRTEFFTEDNFSQASKDAMKGLMFLDSKDVADSVMYVLGTPPNVHIGELTIRPPCSPC